MFSQTRRRGCIEGGHHRGLLRVPLRGGGWRDRNRAAEVRKFESDSGKLDLQGRRDLRRGRDPVSGSVHLQLDGEGGRRERKHRLPVGTHGPQTSAQGDNGNSLTVKKLKHVQIYLPI